MQKKLEKIQDYDSDEQDMYLVQLIEQPIL